MIKIKLAILIFLCFREATIVSGQTCQCSCNDPSSSSQTLLNKPSKRGKKERADRKKEIEENRERIIQLESVVAYQADVINQLTSKFFITCLI